MFRNCSAVSDRVAFTRIPARLRSRLRVNAADAVSARLLATLVVSAYE
jgi:hypothetical protein